MSMADKSMTQKMMAMADASTVQTGGAGGATTYEALLRLDDMWSKLRSGELPAPRDVVFEEPNAAAETPDFDVVVCGGNIGILLATALVLLGLRVAVLEAGELRGREQDWNASRKEVIELVEAGILSMEEATEQVIGIEFNPVRCGFPGVDDVWLNDVLNVGVRPERLVACARARFEAAGGVVLENTPLDRVSVRPGAAVLSTKGGGELRTRLVVDCMGQRSPIVAQARGGQEPDGVCIVVGSCADGYAPERNTFGDIILADSSTEPANNGCPNQYFWEAFPASASPTQRTTYLFTYLGLEKERPSVLDIMEDYWKLLPLYQGIDLEALTPRRILFGLFTSYKDSPLPVKWDRVMQIGDAGGLQSPLSFGGFGAITRHIGRLTRAVAGALEANALQRHQLALINPYQANLRAAWLFQASMRPPVVPGAWPDDFIVKVLASTFEVQRGAGVGVMLPFLQDTLRVDGLAVTIGGLMLSAPATAVEILVRLGPLPLADWFLHFLGMLVGSLIGSEQGRAALKAAEPSLSAEQRFALNRYVEGWQYGSGLDYVAPDESQVMIPEELSRAKEAAAAARAFVPAAKVAA